MAVVQVVNAHPFGVGRLTVVFHLELQAVL